MSRPHSDTYASTADKYALYQAAVQNPEFDVDVFTRIFVETYHRGPRVLREDFCGTAAVSCAWVQSEATREAHGVDLDPEPLAWAWKHNAVKLDEAARSRLQLLRDDVRSTGNTPPADVVAAQNYSFQVFHTRADLLEYFTAARENLASEGILVLDVVGGPEALQSGHRRERPVGDVTYEWVNLHLDAITHDCAFQIRFRFFDGSELHAFEYRWRFWTLPELRDLLHEAGFARSEVYWGIEVPEGGQTLYRFERRTSAPSTGRWIAYLVGVK